MEQLLKILENNARLPVEDIATMLNKSPAEVAAMMDLARAQGIIKGYKTLVDWEKAKVNRVEAVIELNVSPKKSRGFDEIAATIAAFDEVESVLLMSGGYDLQLVIKGQTFQEIALFVGKAAFAAGRCAAKAINLTTNLTALAVYLMNGKVIFLLGLTAGLFSIAGNYLGAKCFDKGGAKFVKPLMLVVLVIFFVKTLSEIMAG